MLQPRFDLSPRHLAGAVRRPLAPLLGRRGGDACPRPIPAGVHEVAIESSTRWCSIAAWRASSGFVRTRAGAGYPRGGLRGSARGGGRSVDAIPGLGPARRGRSSGWTTSVRPVGDDARAVGRKTSERGGEGGPRGTPPKRSWRRQGVEAGSRAYWGWSAFGRLPMRPVMPGTASLDLDAVRAQFEFVRGQRTGAAGRHSLVRRAGRRPTPRRRLKRAEQAFVKAGWTRPRRSWPG